MGVGVVLYLWKGDVGCVCEEERCGGRGCIRFLHLASDTHVVVGFPLHPCVHTWAHAMWASLDLSYVTRAHVGAHVTRARTACESAHFLGA